MNISSSLCGSTNPGSTPYPTGIGVGMSGLCDARVSDGRRRRLDPRLLPRFKQTGQPREYGFANRLGGRRAVPLPPHGPGPVRSGGVGGRGGMLWPSLRAGAPSPPRSWMERVSGLGPVPRISFALPGGRGRLWAGNALRYVSHPPVRPGRRAARIQLASYLGFRGWRGAAPGQGHWTPHEISPPGASLSGSILAWAPQVSRCKTPVTELVQGGSLRGGHFC